MKLSIRAKIQALCFAATALATGIYGVNAYMLERAAIIDGVDQKLRTAALALPELLSDDFHDRALDAGSISTEEHGKNVKRFTDFARELNISFVCTYVRDGDQIFYTCSSASKEELEKGELFPYFSPYTDPNELVFEAFDEETTQLGDYSDKDYGEFRSVFMARKSPGGRLYVAGADIGIGYLEERLRWTLIKSATIGFVIFGVVSIFSLIITERISRPLMRLSSHTERLVSHDFQLPTEDLEKIRDAQGDEIGVLARSLMKMQLQLIQYIENLKETTAAKEKIESEVRIASEIQQGILPRDFSAFGKHPHVDLYASLESAREVGGDLYDFAFLNENLLYVAVGDVSDKGVPASLFMAVTKTLLRVTAGQEDEPERVLRRVNDDLCQENETGQFVTVFIAVMNVQTGRVVFSDGGHNPPCVRTAHGEVVYLDKEQAAGAALGVFEGIDYKSGSVTLDKGDTLFLYTDGVTEAMNRDDELFGEDRLKDCLAELQPESDAKQTVDQVVRGVSEFAEGREQSDDITVLALRYRD